MKTIYALAFCAALIVGFAGCDNRSPIQEAQQDAAEDIGEANREVREAQREGAEVRREAAEDIQDAYRDQVE